MTGKATRDQAYETYGKWVRLQLDAISKFLDTHDTEELEWVIEHTKCDVCRIHTETALVLWEGGHRELAVRNLDFSIEALKGMLEKTRTEDENGIRSS